MIDKSTCLKFYKRKEIQEALVEHAKDKEIGMRHAESFGKRPDILSYPRDVMELALQNLTSFHASEELWSNPLSLSSTLSKTELENLRTGWDLVLDIDCKQLEYSKICAEVIIEFLQYCDVKNFSIKYSGNKGFHIGVPFEAFPKQIGNQLTKNLFPEAARKIAFYIKENIKEELGKRILAYENNNFAAVQEKVALATNDIIRYNINEFGDKITRLDADKFLEIDTVLISSRHLYRMPYSLHEKSGLVSLPLTVDQLKNFTKEMAKPENINPPLLPFLDRSITEESARRLLVQAYDFKVNLKEDKPKKKQSFEYDEFNLTSPIKEEFFPPCIQNILGGIEDGKKRSIFCLTNYLGKIGWNQEQIEEYIYKWNSEKNHNPLREVYIKGQIQHFRPGERLPPNCDNEGYYKTIGVCKPDAFCRRIKNPANYTILKWKSYLLQKEEEESKPKRGRKKKDEETEKMDILKEETSFEKSTQFPQSPP
jgi:DNA primase catalytic subunit